MQTSEQIAKMLQEYGVTHFFFEPVILPETVKAMAELGILPVMTHGEKSAAYMADGYARVSGRVGVCGAQAIGSTNLAAGLRDPYMARSPVIALSGGPNATTRHRNLYQDVDDRGAFESVTKWNAQVDDHHRFPDLLRQAFRAATSGTPRPVHLEIAGRTGNMGDQEAGGDGYAEPRYGRTPSTRGYAAPELVSAAADLLASASRPLIIAGNGVIRSGAQASLLEFARARSIPIVTTLNGMSAIAFADPLCVGTGGDYGVDFINKLLLDADVILAVGTSLGSMTTKNWTLISDTTKIVQIDVEAEEIGRNYHCEVPLVGDADAILRQLTDTAPGAAPQEWLEHIHSERSDWAAQVADLETSSAVPMRPERLMAMISAGVSDTAVLVGDTGHIGHWAARHLKLAAGHTLIRAAGSLGWALPAAIGAKCAAPDREVVCITGDGGFYYHLAELETARRYEIPVIVVVNNNGGLNQEAFLWDRENPKQHRNWRFVDVNITEVARGLGCHAARVDDPADFQDALETARSTNLPAVLDVRSSVDAIAPKSWGPGL